ncbi:uncharacterized protein LOC119168288 isoform X3 [Rhipicephalus microplus]|uniref:uncharacterized protein LOC119168288 isoform X3 n=1 Tax=Rhipicephalus microplus TaxID=6941 RepID=UPI001888DDBE|nr:uncharacterized protein LOC119168288 isoform X6 [Rhipicephalus microplus]
MIIYPLYHCIHKQFVLVKLSALLGPAVECLKTCSMQFPPELRGSQPFLTSAFQQQEQPWSASLPVSHGPPSVPPDMPSVPLYSGLCATSLEQQQPWAPSSPPLAAFPHAATPWVQTVPQSMPWGTCLASTIPGESQVMRFSAGETPRWAMNERCFRKRHLPHIVDAGLPPRKLVITEEKIAAQMNDLSLDGMVASSHEEAVDKEKRLHVLCPDLEPEPLLPRPVLEDLRKRTSMAVVLWQPPLVQKLTDSTQEAEQSSSDTEVEKSSKSDRQEEETSMDL